MALFYTVDRHGTLTADLEIQVKRYSDLSPPALQRHVDFMFPDGVSHHGNSYFLDSGRNAAVTNPGIELLIEYVRRAHFSEKPSRFCSAFGVETLADAHVFNKQFSQAKSAIWQVEADNYFRCNMSLLTRNQSVLVDSYFAHLYWQGEEGPASPFWEFLLIPPVRVLRQIVPRVAAPPTSAVGRTDDAS